MDSPDREIQHIVDYLASQASQETVEHLEKVASESVYGRRHDIWDVHTDKERWWVITNPMNLYAQKQFPSMDIAISFHIGLMARVLSRSAYAVPDEESQKFASAWRRWHQAGEAFEESDEAEEFQAVGMRCRESLIAFIKEASSVVVISEGTPIPKASDYVNWSNLIAETIAPGTSGDRRRGYLKSTAKSTWELVNWLTHPVTRYDLTHNLRLTQRGIPYPYLRCHSFDLRPVYQNAVRTVVRTNSHLTITITIRVRHLQSHSVPFVDGKTCLIF